MPFMQNLQLQSLLEKRNVNFKVNISCKLEILSLYMMVIGCRLLKEFKFG